MNGSVCDKYRLLQNIKNVSSCFMGMVQVQTMGPGVGSFVLRQKLRTLLPSRREDKIRVSIYVSVSSICFKISYEPWLMWLSGLNAGLRTKGLLVRFPVRAHAWVAGQVPSRRYMKGNHTLMFLSLSSPAFPPL